MSRVGRHVRVNGRVQGVFFRAWTREQAESLGIAGWVRNCADGSVEARVHGEAAAVDDMVARLRQGPPAAAVTIVEVEEVEPGPESSFEIRR
ncbi:MAG: acylphosphatase [Sphingomonas sp.]|nr:acylphosphatase [Sphingomonas sp.]